jgi:hypothetical protein
MAECVVGGSRKCRRWPPRRKQAHLHLAVTQRASCDFKERKRGGKTTVKGGETRLMSVSLPEDVLCDVLRCDIEWKKEECGQCPRSWSTATVDLLDLGRREYSTPDVQRLYLRNPCTRQAPISFSQKLEHRSYVVWLHGLNRRDKVSFWHPGRHTLR